MSDAFNPYAAPQTDALAPLTGIGDGAQDWRLDADRLIVRKGTALPAICVWNGEATTGPRIRRNLTWAPLWVQFLIISPLILFIVYLIVRKSEVIDYALSDAARKRRRSGLLLSWGAIGAALIFIVAGSAFDSPILYVLALPFFVAAVVAAVRGRTIRLVKIDKEFVYLRLPPAAAQAFADRSARGPVASMDATS